ncbi:phosphatidate phosphatase PAH2 [Cajanus cajan]|uniref:phosphatidate phosphatase PAH2 n=1 Tax=Cajanus cajan TaxID=3821 RepID=UPI00098DD257|nr:phosphatidate phosphatase PAH2 [Cajanus cajan]XP_020231800.1 phosphatidate phosphatase PAH2 [Cajanus cajan]
MQAMGRLGSYITRGVCTVSGPFLPFGGAVDIVVVKQKDGSFKSSPWYVRFGKFHKVLKEEEKEKVKVHVSVNGVESDFYMRLNAKGEAVFFHAKAQEEEEQEQDGESVYGGDGKRHLKSRSFNFDSLDKRNSEAKVVGRSSRSRRILGHVFGSRSLRGGGGDDDVNRVDSMESAEIAAKLMELKWSTNLTCDQLPKRTKGGALNNGLPPRKMKEGDCSSNDNEMLCLATGCGDVRVHAEEVLHAATLLQPQVNGRSVMEVSDLHSQQRDCSHSSLCDAGDVGSTLKFRKSKTVNIGQRDCSVKVSANTPTSEQLASLNLKEGRNTIIFSYSTATGKQQIDAQIYLWKWNTRIVISDVDGTITRSDVLGQFMPLVGIDWSQTGVAHLFSAIKENGYQLLFLSARAISQAYHTRQFLCNLKQDGKVLPDGPVVISPDGLFPSLYREVIRRAPHEFKIACLEDIKALFPPDCNPFYAGFGNRDTDEVSYLKVGIPKGKVFIINPRGEIAVNRRCFDTQSYTSLHTLVHGMFPSTNSYEQEDFNSWNYWKLPAIHT